MTEQPPETESEEHTYGPTDTITVKHRVDQTTNRMLLGVHVPPDLATTPEGLRFQARVLVKAAEAMFEKANQMEKES